MMYDSDPFDRIRIARKNPARMAALEASQRHYQGKRCRHGHDGLRYAASNDCVECARLANAKSRNRALG
jgi:hypothetical protein